METKYLTILVVAVIAGVISIPLDKIAAKRVKNKKVREVVKFVGF